MDHVQNIVSVVQRALQNPDIDYKQFVQTASWGIWGLETYILLRQLPFYSKPAPPAALSDHIPQDTFDKAQSYSRERSRFGIFRQLYEQVVSWTIVWSGAYRKCWGLSGRLLSAVGLGFVTRDGKGSIPQSLLYATLLTMAAILPSLPISFYSTFVIEERHGFNKSTVGLWIMDQLKGWFVGAAVGLPVLAAFLAIAGWAGKGFVAWLMAFFLVFQLSFQLIYPTFIQPLFNKLTPLPEGELRTRVEALANRLQFPLKHLYVIDGSKRSGHSNAYFYGLPWSKHIVIYDTLIEKSTPEEVEAVLAHELGHWKYSHPTKLLAISQIHLFLTLSAFTLFINNPALFSSFGFPPSISNETQPIVIGFLLFQLVSAPIDPIVSALMNALTRKYEYEADEFACSLGPSYAAQLSSALIKLQNQNLSSPWVDWLYSAWNHSHPTLLERLSAMGTVGGESEAVESQEESKKEL